MRWLLMLFALVSFALPVARDSMRLSAQAVSENAASSTVFEAASIKVNTSGQQRGDDSVLPGGRYIGTNLSLLVYIRFAYESSPRSTMGLAPFEVRGGPEWIGSERYDIHATAGREVSLTELRAMLRHLLAERFQLKTHVEQKPGPVYRMVLAQPGRRGPLLRPATTDCAVTGPGPACGYFGPSPAMRSDPTRAYQAIRGMTMEDIALRLFPYLGRRVIDETGLSGYFDGDIEFTDEIVMPPPPPGGVNPYDGRDLPSIFEVLPRQLGLRLDTVERPVDILVVDHAAHPTTD